MQDLIEACLTGNIQKVKQLLKAKTDVNYIDQVYLLVFTIKTICLHTFMSRFGFCSFLQQKRSPLLCAAFKGNVELVQILLNCGADIDITGPVR